MIRRLTRLVTGVLSYYAVNLILCSQIKNWIGGPTGIILSCFVQMFYIAFLYPLCLKYTEKPDPGNGIAAVTCYYNSRRIDNTPVVLFSILLPKLQ